MKTKSIFNRAIFFFILTSISLSCNESNKTEGEAPYSMVGQIVGYKITDADATLSGVTLDGLNIYGSALSFYHRAAEKISMDCFTNWDGYDLRLKIGPFNIEGKRSHVYFDENIQDATVQLNGEKYESVPCYINGWIKDKNESDENTVLTRSSSPSPPAKPEVLCEINIECDIDGEKLDLKITSVKP